MSSHKQWVSEIFDRAASQYGKKSSSFFNYFGKRLVEQVDIPLKAHILDVATGRGAVLFPLTEAVGSSGRVVGIDISLQMLQETSKDLLERNMSGIELLCMDAERLDFPDNSFDFVFCGFALFFLPSLLLALSEFKRVLKPGGVFVASTWGRDSELKAWMNEETEKICPQKSLATSHLRTEKELQRVLEEAHFKKICITEETKTFFHPTPEEWWESLWSHGTRAKFEQLLPDQVESLHKNALKKAFSLDEGQGIAENLQVFYGVAQKSY